MTTFIIIGLLIALIREHLGKRAWKRRYRTIVKCAAETISELREDRDGYKRMLRREQVRSVMAQIKAEDAAPCSCGSHLHDKVTAWERRLMEKEGGTNDH